MEIHDLVGIGSRDHQDIMHSKMNTGLYTNYYNMFHQVPIGARFKRMRGKKKTVRNARGSISRCISIDSVGCDCDLQHHSHQDTAASK